MCYTWQTVVLLWLFLASASGAGPAGPVQFQRHAFTLPVPASAHQLWRFADLGKQDRADLLVVDPTGNRLLIYRQTTSGFGNSPDQTIPLPAQTAWIAQGDVDSHPGVELLFSTATGLVYFRQNGGVFESQPRTLIQTNQVFTGSAFPILTELARDPDGTNDLIPVISAGEVVIHQRTGDFKWTPGPPVSFELKRAGWYSSRSDWAAGSNPSWTMSRQQVFRASSPRSLTDQEKAENDLVRKIIGQQEPSEWLYRSVVERIDVNGDGRLDVAFWAVIAALDVKCQVYVFLRGADNQLPEQPSYVARGRGFPLDSPLCDLNGDGKPELVLVALNASILSSSGIANTLVTGLVQWEMTIRSLNNGGFSGKADTLPLTTMASSDETLQNLISVDGDFNGDGRPDLLTKQSLTQWNLQLSTTNGTWFNPQPAATFEIPFEGWFKFSDLNGDHLSDLIAYPDDQPQLVVFLSHRIERKTP